MLEVLPQWADLAVEGARQTARGEGPLQGAIAWADLRLFHASLKLATSVFGAVERREEALGRELASLDLAGEGVQPSLGETGWRNERERDRKSVARSMVEQVLFEL